MSSLPTIVSESIADAMGQFAVPGLSAAVIENGRVSWSRGFGACRDGRSVADDTVFAAASLSKPPFAYTVLRLSERAIIDLDAPLTEAVPMTARHVLSHTSGLGNWELEDAGRVGFEPGSRWYYSGEGYVQLQSVVERLTGTSLDRLASAEVFGPLGLRSTAYAGATIYASHSLQTTAADYARFVLHTIESETGRAMLAPQVAIDEQLAWGLGWGLAGDVFWHWGEMRNAASVAAASPRDGNGLVCLTNGDEGLAACAEIVERSLGDEFALPFRTVIERGW